MALFASCPWLSPFAVRLIDVADNTGIPKYSCPYLDLAQEESVAAAWAGLPICLPKQLQRSPPGPGYLHLAFQLPVWNRRTRLPKLSGDRCFKPLLFSFCIDRLALHSDDKPMHPLSILVCLRLSLLQLACYLTQASSGASGVSCDKEITRLVSSDTNITVQDHACNEGVYLGMPAAASSRKHI